MTDTLDLVSVTTSGDEASAAPRRRRVPIPVRIATLWVAGVAASAALAGVLPLADPIINVESGVRAPFTSWPESLGTDPLGRSVLSRLVYGARVSLLVGLVSTAIGFVIGVAVGLFAGANRAAEHVVGVVTDAMLAIPGIVTLLALGAVLCAGFTPMLIGLSIFAIPPFVRLARANTRAVREREHVMAARLLGAGPVRVVVREILPSVLRPVLAYAVVIIATLMVAEASVSFLGLGVMPPTPSWGSMIANGQSHLATHPSLVLLPAVALFTTVYSFSVVGRWLRDLTSTAA